MTVGTFSERATCIHVITPAGAGVYLMGAHQKLISRLIWCKSFLYELRGGSKTSFG